MRLLILLVTFFTSNGHRLREKSWRRNTHHSTKSLAQMLFAVQNLPRMRQTYMPEGLGHERSVTRRTMIGQQDIGLRMQADDGPSDVEVIDIDEGQLFDEPLKSAGQFSLQIPTMFEDDGVGIRGRWREVAGNFVLYPKDVEIVAPKGLIHFLGGAFVGAAPHITYRYLLDSLCDEGYIIVTTPYRLGFDYSKTCDEILSKFEVVDSALAAKFDALPVIGIGHSCGALLHTIITSTHHDSQRAANVLISFNNKPAKEAIPGFEEFVVPISEQIMGTYDNPQASEPAASVRDAFVVGRDILNGVLDVLGDSDLAPSVVKDEVVPAVKQSLEVVDQFPDLLTSIADGAREFTPSPTETREKVRSQYRSRRTLLIQFENDDIDESPEIDSALRDASEADAVEVSNEIDGNLKPPMEIKLTRLGGTHITPLTQNVILEPPQELLDSGVPDPLMPVREIARENFLRTVSEVKQEIAGWLSQGVSR